MKLAAIVSAFGLSLFAFGSTLGGAETNQITLDKARSAPSHPWLFLTTADVQRAHRAVKEDKTFAALANSLSQRARTNRVETLPTLETNWWSAARAKPWKDTYQEIYHHTWKVPGTWSSMALACARANLLGDSHSAQLANEAKDILLRLSSYSFEFEHFDVGMNYTVWGAEVLEAYDILYSHFDDAERARMNAFFTRMLAAVQKSDDYWIREEPGGTVNNHYAWHKLCYVMLGLFYDRPELIDAAFTGPKGIEFMLQHGFKDDGLWIEGSIPYQFAAAEPLLQAAELLENAGALKGAEAPRNLYSFETKDGRNLAQSYRALLSLLWPDRTLPTVGDAYARRPHLGTHEDFEVLFRRFHEPSFGWLIADRHERSATALFAGEPTLEPNSPPPQASRLWPEMGYVALRSNEGTNYWAGHGWSVFATFSHRPIHQHADKLSLNLFGEGHLWLPDIEARTSAEHAFSSDVQSQLNRQTLCHNTLLVDGESQIRPKQPLELIEFSSLPHVKRATFGDLRGQLYPGVRQMRTVIVTTNYVIDFFQVQSDQPHQFAWLTHVDGESVSCSASNFSAAPLPNGVAWTYLRDPQAADVGNHFSEIFREKTKSRSASLFQMDLWSNNSFQLVRCGFPLAETADSPSMPMRMAQAQTTAGWFLAIYRAGPGADAQLDARVEKGPLNTWTITLVNTPGQQADKTNGSANKHLIPRLGMPF